MDECNSRAQPPQWRHSGNRMSFDDIVNQMIARLYERVNRPGSDDDLSGQFIMSLVEDVTGRAIAERALRSLLARGLLQQTFAITDENFGHYSVTERLLAEGENAKSTEKSAAVPASDRFVELDHNSAAYAPAVSATDEVIKAVAGDNEYGSQFPAERQVLVSSLQAGRELLDAPEVRPSAVQRLLVAPLKFVAETFAKNVISSLAAKAVAAVLKLIGVV